MIHRPDNTTLRIASAQQDVEQDTDFRQRVLHFLKTQQPDDSLAKLLEKLKSLAPQHKPTMAQLSAALNQATADMRPDSEQAHYLDTVLNRRAVALTGVNYFFNKMMLDSMLPHEESNNEPERW